MTKAVAYVALALPALFIDPLPIGGRIEVFKITVGLRGEVYLRDVYRVEIRHELSVDRRAADNKAALIFRRQRKRLPVLCATCAPATSISCRVTTILCRP